ncbi:MAG: hypothetical protein AAF702_44105 [Chloroflexota bacterium]
MKSRHYILFGVVAALIIILTLIMSRISRGDTTQEAVVERYLQALLKEDTSAIRRLIPHTHIVEEEKLQQQIMSSGGANRLRIQVKYLEPENPRHISVKIMGAYQSNDGGIVDFQDHIGLQLVNERWYLIMGRHKNGFPDLESPLPSSSWKGNNYKIKINSALS